MKEIADIIREFNRRRGESMALATLIRTWGSSYRRPGARMLVTRDGQSVGSLSGGCLEQEVAIKAQEVLQTGLSELMTFDTRRRFGCNGGLEILIERLDAELMENLACRFRSRRSSIISTISTGIMGSRWLTEMPDSIADGELVQEVNPPLQLLVVGDGPDTPALHQFAETMGWVMQNLEHANEIEGPYDEWTAALVKTHNYGRDFAALRALLSLNLRYVGLMGPRARREQLLGDLLDTGIAPGPNLHAPAGLDLGASAPEAIALSIVAEIQAVFAHRTGSFLRERKAPIHGNLPGAAISRA